MSVRFLTGGKVLAVRSLVAQNTVSLRKWLSCQALTHFSRRTDLTNQGLLEPIIGLAKIYHGATKERKGQLLRDSQSITGRSERTLLRYLAIELKDLEARLASGKAILTGRGRPPKYNMEALLPFIKDIWFPMEQICASRMHAGLSDWLKHYNHSDLRALKKINGEIFQF